MFENATKEDLVTVLVEMGEIVDADLGIMELKQKLMLIKAYLEDEKFVRGILATTIEDRMEKEVYRKKEEKKKEEHRKKEEYKKKEEEFKKKAEERHLERIQKLELARIEAARGKVDKAKIIEAWCKAEEEAKLKAGGGT
ncbi:hypothetical protein TNCT_88461 [Trichonephila clavata]|uniref:Uncharacterized protein n=1 Tax=Trichonephila clavata TaxID=2740835 RepID=A0A8X6ISZ6_TRICU|nr:hypothetical protein TNCT_88461 [Trichonephila clavata]